MVTCAEDLTVEVIVLNETPTIRVKAGHRLVGYFESVADLEAALGDAVGDLTVIR